MVKQVPSLQEMKICSSGKKNKHVRGSCCCHSQAASCSFLSVLWPLRFCPSIFPHFHLLQLRHLHAPPSFPGVFSQFQRRNWQIITVTKILIKVQMWCGDQKRRCYEINTVENTHSNGEDAQPWKQPRPKPAITQAASSGNLAATRRKWRRFQRRRGETVAGGKRRGQWLPFITKHREESLWWYWRHQSGFQQQLLIRKQVKRDAEEKLCVTSQRIFMLNGGSMFKVSFLVHF